MAPIAFEDETQETVPVTGLCTDNSHTVNMEMNYPIVCVVFQAKHSIIGFEHSPPVHVPG